MTESHAYAFGRVRALEVALIDTAQLKRMVDARTADDALKVLSETPYGSYLPEHPDIPDIEKAIDTLGLGNWFYALPDGLDTRLKTGGQGLSAGEAQLLAFTRLFLRDPQLVILDEASSRLDPATEVLLERAIDRLLQNRTGIIIAHRLQTVQRADDILILENGRSLEHGLRTNLANDPNSRLAHLLQTGLQEVLA